MAEDYRQHSTRALDRGLTVVEFLAARGAVSLADLRRHTGLGNATLLRLLNTLAARGWVRRSLAEGRWELTHSFRHRIATGAATHPLAELAAPLLAAIAASDTGFAADLCAVIAPGHLEVVESSRTRGPMAPARSAVGVRPSLVRSAHGRAILAFMPEDERRVHLQVLARAGNAADRAFIESGRLEPELAATRSRGFGRREPDYWIVHRGDPGPELGVIAVPIVSRGGVFGSISILWLVDELPPAEPVEEQAHALAMRTVVAIADAAEAAGLRPPNFAGSGG